MLPLSAARAWMTRSAGGGADAGAAPVAPVEVSLDVVYDGPDLDEHRRAARDGRPTRSPSGTGAAEWTVAFSGFAPGFAYLVSAGWRLRRAPARRARARACPPGRSGSPGSSRAPTRARRPAAGASSARPPRRCSTRRGVSPALLAPGARVRFVPGRAQARIAIAAPTRDPAAPRAQRRRAARRRARAARDDPGPRTPGPGVAGHRALWRARSRGAAHGEPAGRATPRTRRASRSPSAASARSPGTTRWIAVAGAWGDIRIDGRAVDPYVAHPWPAGTELAIDWFAHGARAYLAVRGGLDAPARRRLPLHRHAVPPRAGRPAPRATSWASAPTSPPPCRRATSRRGAHRTTTRSWCTWRPARGRTGSRHPRIGRSSRRRGPSRRRPTASACGWTGRRWSGRGPASCPARAWFPGRSRCRPRACRPCCSPTAPSPAATP